MTFGEAPPNPEYPLPEEAKNLVMHAQLGIFGTTVMFSDTFPGSPFVVGNNMSLTIVTNDEDALRKSFAAISVDGKVGMELQETFWSKCYGSVIDKFGVNWQFSYEGNEGH